MPKKSRDRNNKIGGRGVRKLYRHVKDRPTWNSAQNISTTCLLPSDACKHMNDKNRVGGLELDLGDFEREGDCDRCSIEGSNHACSAVEKAAISVCGSTTNALDRSIEPPILSSGFGSLSTSVYNASALLHRAGVRQTLKMVEIVPKVYLGDVNDIRSVLRHGEPNVLNLAGDVHSAEEGPLPLGVTALYVYAKDKRDYPILRLHFKECRRFIDASRRRNGVLVCCQAGVNRSAVIVAAYMLVTERLPLSAVLSHMRLQRGILLTNLSFLGQLVEFAEKMHLLDL